MAATIASLHYIALGLGFSGLLLRQYALKASFSDLRVKPIFLGDNLWALAALLWLTTGLARAFGGLAKGSDYYLSNHWFYAKMTLFLCVFLLEIYPIVMLMKWRAQKKQVANPADVVVARKIYKIGWFELVLTVGIIFLASKMARGM